MNKVTNIIKNNKLKVLMWKHLTVRMKRYIQTPIEILSPLTYFVLFFVAKCLLPKAPTQVLNALSDYNVQGATMPLDMTSMVRPQKVFYTPQTDLTDLLMERVSDRLSLKRQDIITGDMTTGTYYTGLKNESDYERYFSDIRENVDAILIFPAMRLSWPDKLEYTIRMKNDFNTKTYDSGGAQFRPKPSLDYSYESFIKLQWAVDTSYLELVTGQEVPQKLTVEEFSTPSPIDIFKVLLICVLMPFLSWISLLLVFVFFMVRVTEERLNGIQELLRMVGVSNKLLVISHFLDMLPACMVYCFGIQLLMWTQDPFLNNSNRFIVLLAMLLNFYNVISMAYATSYLIRRDYHTVTVATLSYIGLRIPAVFIKDRERSQWLTVLLGLVPFQPVNWLWTEVASLEGRGSGLTFSTMWKPHNAGVGSVLMSYILLLVNSSMFIALGWFLSRVNPGPYGQPMPWNFLCKKNDKILKKDTEEDGFRQADSAYLEPGPPNAEVGIKVINVSKVYGNLRVLDNVTMDVYKGEITILLGHNGAGKTTLMSIITGMISATEGNVYVDGFDTIRQKEQTQKLLGLCPQHNLFFPELTLLEHVIFFTMLKGPNYSEAKMSSTALLEKLGLSDKLSYNSSQLSGGMKRRLQLACALAGDAKVLVLDEPTSGLDLETRRELWNLLLSLRGSHTVLISTHFMEEAEALGDRVAALHAGRLRCHATPMYLKRAIEITFEKLSGSSLYASQLVQLMKRQLKFSLSSIVYFVVMQVIVPVTMICLFTYLCRKTDKQSTRLHDAVPLELDPNMPEHEVLFNVNLTNFGLRREGEQHSKAHHKITSNGNAIYQISMKNKTEHQKYLVGVELNDTNAKIRYPILIRHAAPAALNLLSNMIATHLMPHADGTTITTRSHPLKNLGHFARSNLVDTKSEMDCAVWTLIIITITMCTLVNGAALPCSERATCKRHIHVLAGCPPALHWAATLLAHLALYLPVLLTATVVSAAVFDKDHTIDQPSFLVVLSLVLTLGCMSFLAFMYLISLYLAARGTTITLVICIILFCFIAPGPVFDQYEKPELKFLPSLWGNTAGLTVPPFTVIMASIKTVLTSRVNSYCNLNKDLCPNIPDTFSFEVDKCCGPKGNEYCYICFHVLAPFKEIIFLLLQFLGFMFLVVLAEHGVINRFFERIVNRKYAASNAGGASDMVQAEKEYVDDAIKKAGVDTGSGSVGEFPCCPICCCAPTDISDAMLVSNVHKNYWTLFGKSCNAVRGIDFSVKRGECFGLLGVNGAGKSTTFKMLTGVECATRGCLYANGHFISSDSIKYMQSLSYCPQFFGLDDFLTGHDNLTLLLTLRGLSPADVKSEANAWITIVGLEQYADVKVSGYSGGCARRLAAAAALCCGNAVTLLDEPTSGVDVAARRRVWAAVRRASRSKRSIIITSHSMDEMEALCGRIAILSAGRVVALGETAALRAAHATGHALHINVAQGKAGSEVSQLKAAIEKKFNCTLREEHATRLDYHINETMLNSVLFSGLEELRAQFPALVDYSVTTTTLEEVFLSYAKDATQEADAKGATQKAGKGAKNPEKRAKTKEGTSKQNGHTK